MNKNALANIAHDFVIKDVTVKEIGLTLNVGLTDMDKINSFSSQATWSVLLYHMHTLEVFLATGKQPGQKLTVQDRTRHRSYTLSICLW